MPLNEPQQRYRHMVEKLKSQDFRLTPQRLAVLRILSASEGHPSVEDMHRRILQDFPTTSLATVYKIVNLLKEQGEVLELRFNHLGSRYDGNTPQPHPHVVCTGCGLVVDPEDTPLDALEARMAEQTGFRITSHRLDFYGLCPDCLKKQPR